MTAVERLTFAPGTFAPDPRQGSSLRMTTAASVLELKMMLRNGEQLLLALVIPLAVLIGLNASSVFSLDEPRIASVTPGVLTLALMSTAFTAQAITTAFDRRYGVLKRLAAAGVGRGLLVAGKIGASSAVIIGQLILLGTVAAIMDWRPHGSPLWALLVIVLAVAAFVGMALLVGGTLRAEAVLALANLLWLAMVVVGGVVAPLDKAPGWLHVLGELTPAGALSLALRAIWRDGQAPSGWSILVLVAWALIAWAGVTRWFKWQ